MSPRVCRVIQTIIEVTIANGDDGDDGLELLLLALGEVAGRRSGGHDADRDAERDPVPTPTQTQRNWRRAAALGQERGDDADDQGRLDALASPMTNVGST